MNSEIKSIINELNDKAWKSNKPKDKIKEDVCFRAAIIIKELSDRNDRLLSRITSYGLADKK